MIATSLTRWFELRERKTTVARELRGAIATFLTMAYILFVNADILSKAGVPFPQAVACTALAAGVCSILMGIFANFPIALASGMGLNAIVAFTITPAAGSWQAAMGLVVLDGLITALLVLCGLREAVMNAIPHSLRMATGAGIGLFIAFIGLVNARIVIVPKDTVHVLWAVPNATMPPVAPGTLCDPVTAIALAGLLIMSILMARKIKGALVIGIFATTVLALCVGVAKLPAWDQLAWPSFKGVAFAADLRGALQWKLMPLLFAVIMVDFFDTLGTATAVAEEADLMDAQGRIPRVRALLLVDSLSASIGGMLGASSVTSYIESAAGVAEGARTGLHSVFVGLLFLLAIVAAPLAGVVPAAATAPALILVGFLMIGHIAKLDFDDAESAIPAFLTLLTIPLTYSIAHGVGYGFISHVAIKLLCGKWRQVHAVLYVVAAAFAVYFVWGAA